MITQSKKNTILIGLGKISSHYVSGILKSPYYNLTHICDVDTSAEAIKLFGEGVTFVSDYLPVFKASLVEVAIIATPPFTHYDIIKDCMEYGILPVVEKPISYDESEFNNLLKTGADFKVMFHWQYGSEVLYFMKHEFPKIKKINSIDVQIKDPYLDKTGSIDRKFLNKGGCWLDSGVNALSLISQMVNLDKCSIVDFKLENDKTFSQPYHALCSLKCRSTNIRIEVSWNSNETDQKVTIISSDIGEYVLDHSMQTLSLNDRLLPVEAGSNPRLTNHYNNLFNVHPEELSSQEGVRAIHMMLFKPMRQKRLEFYGWISRCESRASSFVFANDDRKKKMVIGLYFLLALLIVFSVHNIKFDPIKEILMTVCAFLLSVVFYNLFSILFKFWEDRKKVIHDNERIEKMYGKSYRHHFLLNATPCCLYYDDCWSNDHTKNYTFEVSDKPEKMFEMDDFIRNNQLLLMKAHENSKFVNMDTVRLDGFKADSHNLCLNTSRSTYFAHLVTNRAVDYPIDGSFSLRQKYEYRKNLTPLELSAFSNHIGILGLIMLNDGYTLFPHRASSGTISKNMITSGIAAPLLAQGFDTDEVKSDTIPFESYIRKVLPEVMMVKDDFLNNVKVEVNMIGLGRDVYEGGKPSCFYLISVDKSSIEYLSATEYYLNAGTKEKDFDHNKKIYVAQFNSIKWHQNGELLIFNSKNANGELTEKCIRPEKNLLCNLYHYFKYNSR